MIEKDIPNVNKVMENIQLFNQDKEQLETDNKENVINEHINEIDDDIECINEYQDLILEEMEPTNLLNENLFSMAEETQPMDSLDEIINDIAPYLNVIS